MGSPIQTPSVLLMISNAKHVEAIIISLCCASQRDAARAPNSKKATSPNATIAVIVDVVPATPHVGTAAEAIGH